MKTIWDANQDDIGASALLQVRAVDDERLYGERALDNVPSPLAQRQMCHCKPTWAQLLL